MKLYGITNCDTVKKARDWLTSHALEYEFHDYKKQAVDSVQMQQWVAHVGWEKLVNRQGQTWRKLSDLEKAEVKDNASATRLMLAKPSVIKRPILEHLGKIHLGFSVELYQSIFKDIL